jgi:hypothetical protein
MRVSQVLKEDLPAKLPMAAKALRYPFLNGLLGFRAILHTLQAAR